MSRNEALVVCGEKKKEGITIYDLKTNAVLLKLPNCSSPRHGLLFQNYRNVLVASPLHKDRPFGCGSIFFWPLNKPQALQISYPIEAIGPIASSKCGVYLVGGSRSGNAYVWEVTSGRLLKNWHAHDTPISCLTFSHDDSFLITGSEDGLIRVWSMIILLNTEDHQINGSVTCFRSWSEHVSAVTGLVPVSCVSGPSFVSSSLDGCKVWEIISGSILQNHYFSSAVTALAVDPLEQLLVSGREDGDVYVNELHLGVQEIGLEVFENESRVLHEHRGPITSLAFDLRGTLLASASKDCMLCLWNMQNWQAIRKFNHENGTITNLLVIPISNTLTKQKHRHTFNPQASLQKTYNPTNAQGILTTLPKGSLIHEELDFTNSLSCSFLNKLINDTESPEVIKMKTESSIENRLKILNMTKDMNSINRHLQLRITDMMINRLCDHDTNLACLGRGHDNYKDLQENQ